MSASTGSPARRAERPAAPGAAPETRERLDALDELEREVRAQFAAVARSPGAAELADSARRTLSRVREGRAAIRQRLNLLPARPQGPQPPGEADLDALQQALSDYTYAYADAVAALDDPRVVGRLVEQLRAAAGLLAIVEIWAEAERTR